MLYNLCPARSELSGLNEDPIERINIQPAGQAELAEDMLSVLVLCAKALSLHCPAEALAIKQGRHKAGQRTSLAEASLLLCAKLVAGCHDELYCVWAYAVKNPKDLFEDADAHHAKACPAYLSIRPFNPYHCGLTTDAAVVSGAPMHKKKNKTQQ